MENPLKNLIEIIKTGSPQEVKEAQKKIERFWHDIYLSKRKEGKQAFSIFLDEIKKFDEIKDINHKAYFINTLKWPFWSIGEEFFEQWADFILKYIQHPSGKIRRAIVRAADYLITDLIFGLGSESNERVSQAEKEKIRQNKIRFGCFVEAVEELLRNYEEPRFRRYKYITSMPPSVYKSLQQLMVEDLLPSKYYEDLYLEYKYEQYEQQKERAKQLGVPTLKEKDWEYYYDAMEYLNSGDTRMAELLLKKAIATNKDFVAGYVGLTAVAKEEKDRKKEKEYANLAFEKTRKVFPVWPDKLPWGVIDNRQYLRAICDQACVYHTEGNFQEAEKLYRLLLKLNPTDNQGVRYLIAGMFAGLKPKDIDKLFDQGNKRQNWDKLEKLVKEQNKKHHFLEEPKELES